jgi:hypothetical protein
VWGLVSFKTEIAVVQVFRYDKHEDVVVTTDGQTADVAAAKGA